MRHDEIKPRQTYRSYSGALVYVQDISGQKVTYSQVGNVERHESSLGRFAARMCSEAPNQ